MQKYENSPVKQFILNQEGRITSQGRLGQTKETNRPHNTASWWTGGSTAWHHFRTRTQSGEAASIGILLSQRGERAQEGFELAIDSWLRSEMYDFH